MTTLIARKIVRTIGDHLAEYAEIYDKGEYRLHTLAIMSYLWDKDEQTNKGERL
jgi:hypothetical protein